jgi:hypothetical protein
MQSTRVLVRPVNDAALIIPCVFTGEFNRIAHFQPGQAWRQVNVVGNEERLSRIQAQDEPLMSVAVRIVRENADDLAVALDQDIAAAILESSGDDRVGRCGGRPNVIRGAPPADGQVTE